MTQSDDILAEAWREACRAQPSRAQPCSTALAPHIAGSPLPDELVALSTSRNASRRKKPKKNNDLTLHIHPSAPPIPSAPPPPPGPPPSTVDDPLSYALDAFDTLIAPMLTANVNLSFTALRRCLYRRQFSQEVTKLLVSRTHIFTEDLVQIIHEAARKCNIVLM